MMSHHWDYVQAYNHCHNFVEVYKSLHLEAKGMKVNKWNIKPKFHLFQELVQYQSLQLGKPMGFWEYTDEDFVGLVAKLATRRGGANTHRVLADKVLWEYKALWCQYLGAWK